MENIEATHEDSTPQYNPLYVTFTSLDIIMSELLAYTVVRSTKKREP